MTSRGTAGTCSDGEAIFANVGNAADWIAGFLTVDPVEPDPGGDDPGGGDPGGDDPGGDDPGGGDPGGDDPGGGGGDPAPDPGGDDPGPAPDPGEPSGLGQFGESCDRAQACASQACVTLGEGAGYCTEPCTDACPYGYECTSTDSGHFCMFGGTDRGPGGDPLGPEGTAGYAGREGCSAAPRRADPNGGTLLLALALLLWRPRRPARSEPQPTREVTRAVDPLLSSRLPV